MKFLVLVFLLSAAVSCNNTAKINTPDVQPANTPTTKSMPEKKLFLDIHDLTPGKVAYADVAAAHQKDLATQGKYDVNFIRFWVDEKQGKVYCLSSARDTQSIIHTHAEAHGLLPSTIYEVTDGVQSDTVQGLSYFIDVHNIGAGKVNADGVAKAHEKDLATEKKYGVHFIKYWLDEKTGTVFCLSQAPDSSAIIKTHKEAHGLLPNYIEQVKQGQ